MPTSSPLTCGNSGGKTAKSFETNLVDPEDPLADAACGLSRVKVQARPAGNVSTKPNPDDPLARTGVPPFTRERSEAFDGTAC